MTEKTAYVDNARGYAQGENFLMKGQPGRLDALVFNTTGLNQCPPEKFNAIDVDVLAQETESDVVWKNPRRFWMMDRLTIALVGEPRDFQGLMFNFVAEMQMPADFTPDRGQTAIAYRPSQISRVSRYEFLSGRPVFLLRSPEGVTFVMQTYTNHKASDLAEADLPELGHRLQLADGWQFKAKTLDRDLILDTNGLAHIVADDLENMYQGCTEDVTNVDPWH
ncbi:hypothetical protein [Actinomycetospora chibensis]|uniref:Uncharacterized protein n=1 Tax=Actinomycetospora chibensis TaxID=663606 RepID=A0ABV9RFN8_9PSEU|nr:hypothetical protein [Actinomycetospora chibensis]MDD7922898.1 hypothetical protein [Actinomycetospora chibensis]